MPRGGDTQRQASPCYASRNMQWDETQCTQQRPAGPWRPVLTGLLETWLSLAGSERSLSPELGQQLVCLLLTSSALSLSRTVILASAVQLPCTAVVSSASELFLHSPLTAVQRWAPQGTNLYPDQNQRKCGGSLGFHKPWISTTTVTYGKQTTCCLLHSFSVVGFLKGKEERQDKVTYKEL